jgi:archaellin
VKSAKVSSSETVNSFFVIVPVLSEHRMSIPAISSIETSLLTMASFLANARAPTAMVTVRTAGMATGIVWEVGSPYQLVAGQKVRITINLERLSIGGTGVDTNTAAGCVLKNEEFKIVIKPPTGSVLEIDRIAPAAVGQVNDLG